MTTIDKIKAIQKSVLVKQDGILGPLTIQAIYDKVVQEKRDTDDYTLIVAVSGVPISVDGFKFIVDQETGGKEYYESKLMKPTWPGGESGVTIGVGYDLRFYSELAFREDWDDLPDAYLNRLENAIGKSPIIAKELVKGYSNIEIPWNNALLVFARSTMPKFWDETKKAFPGVDQLCESARTALLSLVFNRGASMEGERRAEMRAIKAMVPKKDYKGIAGQLREMKRLWEGKGLDGLLTRREEEAKLVEKCM